MEDLRPLLELVGDLCTREQIKGVLDEARGNKAVKLTALNKDDLLHENLADALKANAVGIDRVYKLLHEAEENGDQHIFYYKLITTQLLPSMSFDALTRGLRLSKNKLAEFPKLDLIPNNFVLADVRIHSSRRNLDWVYKVYGDETREHFTGRIIREPEGDESKYLKEFEEKKLRHVLVVRWNYPDLLEIRVPRDTSKTRLRNWRAYLWGQLKPAIDQSWFKEWDLSRARSNLIKNERLDGVLFRLRDTQVEAPGHERATFEAHAPGAGLFSAQHLRDAVGDLLKAKSTCTRLNVGWLPVKGEAFEDEIRTLIGNDLNNEVIFASKQRSTEIDYVTDQLRKFS